MNIYSVIVAALICATVITCIWLILKKPFEIKIVKKDETDLKPAHIVTQDTQEQTEKPVEHEDIAVKSMDAVIKSANELMGIQIEEGTENDDR